MVESILDRDHLKLTFYYYFIVFFTIVTKRFWGEQIANQISAGSNLGI